MGIEDDLELRIDTNSHVIHCNGLIAPNRIIKDTTKILRYILPTSLYDLKPQIIISKQMNDVSYWTCFELITHGVVCFYFTTYCGS